MTKFQIFFFLIPFCLVLSVDCVKNVNLQINNGLRSLEDEEIIRVLVDKSSEINENFTFVNFFSQIKKYTKKKKDFFTTGKSSLIDEKTNHYYGN